MATASEKKAIEDLRRAIEGIKDKLPNGEIKEMQTAMEQIKTSVGDVKEDVRYIKRKLLDPERGVIVKLNKNVDTVSEQEKIVEEADDKLTKMASSIDKLVDWKAGINKALWALFGILIAIIAKIIFFDIEL